MPDTEDIDITQIKKKSLAGVVTLTSRSVVLYIAAIAGNFLLSLYLSVGDFGVYYVVSAIIAFLNYFSDIGLAAALIQKKDEITQEDLTTAFTIQQILAGVLIAVSFVFSLFIKPIYHFNDSGVMLFRALIVAFFLSSVKTIPSVLLERKFQFQLLVIPQIIETLSFYAVAVVLAWMGFGIASLTWAVIIRSILGVIAIYIIKPWHISFGISKKGVSKLLRFGVPFQLNSFLALIKDDLLTVFLGTVLPIQAIGYIGWAKKWSDMPLRMFMDNIIKVTFPAFSRIQNSKDLLGKAVENTIFGVSVTIFPVYVALIFLIEPAIKLLSVYIPRYVQWEPAILAFGLFAGANIVSSISTPLTNIFNAVGKIKTTLGFMVFWVLTTWLATLILIKLIGFNGVPMAVLAVSLSVFLVVYYAKKIIPFRVWDNISTGFSGSLLIAVLFVLFRGTPPYSFLKITVLGIVSIVVYALYVWKAEKSRIVNIYRSLGH